MQHEEPREDDELLARVAAGNQGALSQLIARHSRGLRIFAARYLGNAGDAEDVVQEVFVTIWKQAARFDPARGRASTWLYRITANRCIDQRRRRALRAFIGLDDVRDSVPSEEADAEAAIAARQELAIVRDGLSRLPERQRMAVLLRAVADLDIAAIAEVMGGSAGSAEQLLVRGRRALRDHLRDHLAMAATGRERKSS
ncbi:sigma-70 family RNA polymerase sigma factor [Mesorhizobium sp.]|uniref:RNA polymerase sigma factor n=1 Tax=Mesorhizobium sp. TaxID=1871066 RepID=UPI001228EE3E|nr:sigma-70 family RNA polymerase sigma factor [Mesorhizobium sp.]TIS54555.1 MAG: sigma-70 family RNA polymerase sigma factor [Mesorhizobium sp.]TIS86454.1 MAG: sigma-70 family RNA polymerase sigma factor [Mesorhizobium sp.]